MTKRSPKPQSWSSPENILPLQDNDLQIWRIDLPVAPDFLAACQSVLTTEESARAGRRKQSDDRQHAILGRGALRLLLAANTHLAPADLPIVTSASGKPETPGFAFNITHSGDILLIALQRHGSVGVDIEYINPTTPILDVAAHSFTPTEAAALAAVPKEAARRLFFFQLWARKESLVKADGRGLLLPTNSFEAHDSVTTTAATFRIHNLLIDPCDHPRHAAALATDQPSLNLQLLYFPTR